MPWMEWHRLRLDDVGDHDLLLHDGRPAVFATPEEGRRVADAHLRDELDKVSSDGFEWFSMDRT